MLTKKSKLMIATMTLLGAGLAFAATSTTSYKLSKPTSCISSHGKCPAYGRNFNYPKSAILTGTKLVLNNGYGNTITLTPFYPKASSVFNMTIHQGKQNIPVILHFDYNLHGSNQMFLTTVFDNALVLNNQKMTAN